MGKGICDHHVLFNVQQLPRYFSFSRFKYMLCRRPLAKPIDVVKVFSFDNSYTIRCG